MTSHSLQFMEQVFIYLKFMLFLCSLFHMKVTASITKSLHQDCDPCHLFTLTYFFLIHGLFSSAGIKICCNCCFPQQIRPQITVQLYILQVYSNVRIGFNMISKCHLLPVKLKSVKF